MPTPSITTIIEFISFLGNTRNCNYREAMIGDNIKYMYNTVKYCQVYVTGFGSLIGFIKFLQLVTTSKDYLLTLVQALRISIGHNKSSLSVTVFIIRCLVAASNGGSSLSSGFPNCHRP
jgi:nitrate/nitrite transporter NarK